MSHPSARPYAQTTQPVRGPLRRVGEGGSQVLLEDNDAAAEARFDSPSSEELEVIGLLRSLERPRMPESLIDLRRLEAVIDLRAGLHVE